MVVITIRVLCLKDLWCYKSIFQRFLSCSYLMELRRTSYRLLLTMSRSLTSSMLVLLRRHRKITECNVSALKHSNVLRRYLANWPAGVFTPRLLRQDDDEGEEQEAADGNDSGQPLRQCPLVGVSGLCKANTQRGQRSEKRWSSDGFELFHHRKYCVDFQTRAKPSPTILTFSNWSLQWIKSTFLIHETLFKPDF